MKGLYLMDASAFDRVYPEHVKAKIATLIDMHPQLETATSIAEHPQVLRDIDVIFSGWGAPRLDEHFLAQAPKLSAFFYAAGSLKHIVTQACWQRGLTIASAYEANAIPVAEYTLSQMLFSLKYGWHYALGMKQKAAYEPKDAQHIPGAFASTVGLVSLGMVGRNVCRQLQTFDVHVKAYDPFITQAEAETLGVELCSLETLFAQSDVVSLHTPWLPETEGMINGELFRLMKEKATFINTARGAVVDEPAMIEVLTERQDIMALLDVTYPEPPVVDSPLYTMPNVVLTPHIAGSEGSECGRLSAYMLAEFERYLKNEPLKWPVTKDNFAQLA